MGSGHIGLLLTYLHWVGDAPVGNGRGVCYGGGVNECSPRLVPLRSLRERRREYAKRIIDRLLEMQGECEELVVVANCRQVDGTTELRVLTANCNYFEALGMVREAERALCEDGA